MTKLQQLIQESKGRFFSITFKKKDGTIRTINAKDKYVRLLSQAPSETRLNASRALKRAGYSQAVDRNKETWFNAHTDRVLSFTCGEKHVEFSV